MHQLIQVWHITGGSKSQLLYGAFPTINNAPEQAEIDLNILHMMSMKLTSWNNLYQTSS